MTLKEQTTLGLPPVPVHAIHEPALFYQRPFTCLPIRTFTVPSFMASLVLSLVFPFGMPFVLPRQMFHGILID